MDMSELIRPFITLFVVVDPIGSIPVFLHTVNGVPERLHRAMALRAVFIAACVLMFFLSVGELLIEALGLRLASFEIAGGIVLFLFALQMIFGHSKPETEIAEAEAEDSHYLSHAAFPLAMPSIASPGAILAVVVLTDNSSVSIDEQTVIAGLLMLPLPTALLVILT